MLLRLAHCSTLLRLLRPSADSSVRLAPTVFSTRFHKPVQNNSPISCWIASSTLVLPVVSSPVNRTSTTFNELRKHATALLLVLHTLLPRVLPNPASAFSSTQPKLLGNSHKQTHGFFPSSGSALLPSSSAVLLGCGMLHDRTE